MFSSFKLAALGSQAGICAFFTPVGRTPVVGAGFAGFRSQWPRSDRKVGFLIFFGRRAGLPSYGGDSHSGDLAHGVVEGQARDVDEKVDRVAVQAALRPAPVGF